MNNKSWGGVGEEMANEWTFWDTYLSFSFLQYQINLSAPSRFH